MNAKSPVWAGIPTHYGTQLKLMFTVHAPMPGLVLVWGILFVLFCFFNLLELLQMLESLNNMFAPE